MSVNVVRLRITLLGVEPAPWRETEVPLSMTFKGLHDTIQAAMPWDNAHLWEFQYDNSIYGIPFDDDWDMGPKTFEANNARLHKLKDGKITSFGYVYDMGDNWEHLIEVVELFEADERLVLPRFIDGKWRAPPEDIGGSPGFEYFMEVINDPAHEEYQELIEWHGAGFDIKNIAKKDIDQRFRMLQRARTGNTGTWQKK